MLSLDSFKQSFPINYSHDDENHFSILIVIRLQMLDNIRMIHFLHCLYHLTLPMFLRMFAQHIDNHWTIIKSISPKLYFLTLPEIENIISPKLSLPLLHSLSRFLYWSHFSNYPCDH